MKRYSFASSHLTAPDALKPTMHLGTSILVEGETNYTPPTDVPAVDLVLTELTIATKKVFEDCGLGLTSDVALVVDVECPGFDLKTTVLRHLLDTRTTTTMRDVAVASIPTPIVSEGFSVKLSLVAVNPVVTSPAACTTRGGIVSTWTTKIPSKNKVSPFPMEESANEPSLWRLEVDVDDPDDLDRPVRAAMRLYVDSSRLEALFGTSADDPTRSQATTWIAAEATTSMVMHVLSNHSLRAHFAAWISRNPPIEDDLDVRSIGFYLLKALRATTGPNLDEWYERLVSDPVGTPRDFRAKVVATRTTRRRGRSGGGDK